MPSSRTDPAPGRIGRFRRLFAAAIGALILAACAPAGQPSASPTSSAAVLPTILGATPTPSTSTTSGPTAVVVFVQDGDLRVWDEATSQSQTLFDAGDAIRVTMSDDGEVVAFLRRAAVQRSDSDWREQSALWAVDRTGENPRQLVSAEELRALLGATETDSTNIPQLEWIAGTHRLLFSGWTYLVQAEGESHAVPQGLFAVDADAPALTALVPAGNNLRFVPSPNGQQVALMTLTGLEFINTDGSDHRQNVLPYPQVGMTGPLFPVGVWAQDSRSFVITGSFEGDFGAGFDFSVWRVPSDGSSAESLASVRRSHPASVTFSPDGRQAAYIQYTDQQPSEIAGWFISPLTPEAGPLAIPPMTEVGYASVHWSPAGNAYTGNLMGLCPDAAQDTDICDAPVSFGGSTAAIYWIDATRFLLLTRQPAVLFLGTADGTTRPIVAWPLEEWVEPNDFTAVQVGP